MTKNRKDSGRVMYDVHLSERPGPALRRTVAAMIEHLARGNGAEAWTPKHGGILIRKVRA